LKKKAEIAKGKSDRADKIQFRLGIALIIISCIRYYLPFHIYFLDISMKHKIFFSGLTIGVAELLFWVGLFLVGEEYVKKHWDKLNPTRWFRKKK